MYPGTIFKWHDQSAIASVQPAVVVENRPLFLAAGSFDRGPEEMKIVNANNFSLLYGTKLSFEKHGQAAIQVKNIIDNGGAVLLKRVVAADSTLANTILVASININLTATPDTTGDPKAKTLAEITSGQSTDTSTKYLVESNSTLKWTAVSIANAKTFESVVDASDDLQKDAQFTVGSPDADGVVTITGTADYPLLVIGDNGRGVSSKSVRLTADYNSSKNIAAFFYAAVIYDGTELLGTTMASFDDSVVLNGVNYGLNEFTTEQVKFFENPKYFDKYIDQIVDVTGIAPENIVDYDVIYYVVTLGISREDVMVIVNVAVNRLKPRLVTLPDAYLVGNVIGADSILGDGVRHQFHRCGIDVCIITRQLYRICNCQSYLQKVFLTHITERNVKG